MNHHNKFLKRIAALTAAILLNTFSAPVCYASWEDLPLPLWTAQELVDWYAVGGVEGSVGEPLGISNVVHLGEVGERTLTPWNCGLEVKDGGELILNNPGLTIKQAKAVPITVESGGTLTVRQPFILDDWHTQRQPFLLVKPGGKLVGTNLLPSHAVVRDENTTIDPPPEPEQPDHSLPPVDDGRKPIVSVFGMEYRISCVVGERPTSDQYPAASPVAWLGYEEAPLLPLAWDISNVEFDTAGTYIAIGEFTQAGLDAHNLSNPKYLTVQMIVNVYEKGPTDSLRGFLLETDPNGNTLIKLTMPALPENEVEAVYLYRSRDDKNWEQETWSGQAVAGVPEEETNFRDLVRTEGRNSEIPYRYPTDSQTVWLRTEIVGSAMAGMSNSICLETATLPPEEETAGGDDGMGDRGGGGQEETTRDIPPKGEAAPINADIQQSTSGAAPLGTVEQTMKSPPLTVPEETPSESAAPPPGESMAQPSTVPVQAQATTPERGQPPSIPPIAAVAVALTGAAGLGWVFLAGKR